MRLLCAVHHLTVVDDIVHNKHVQLFYAALFPISVTESGMTTLVNSVHFSNASSSTTVVPSGMMPTPSLISYLAIIQCDWPIHREVL